MYWLKDAYTFFKVESVKTTSVRMSDSSKVWASVTTKKDRQSVVYGRVADSVISGLESIGGFLESLMHIGALLVFFF